MRATFPATSFLGWDFIKSNKLDLGLRCIPISSIIGENGGPRSGCEIFGDKAWLKTSNSSSESATSNTSPSFMSARRDQIVAPAVRRCDETPAFEIPSGIGVVISTPSTFGPRRRKPGTAMLIRWRRGSLALMTHLGAWKLNEIGVYPRIKWAAHNWLSEFINTSALRILSRLSLLTRLKIGSAVSVCKFIREIKFYQI